MSPGGIGPGFWVAEEPAPPVDCVEDLPYTQSQCESSQVPRDVCCRVPCNVKEVMHSPKIEEGRSPFIFWSLANSSLVC